MTKKKLILVVVAWIVLMLLNYYYVFYFILGLEWLAVCITLLSLSIIQIVKLVKERASIFSFRFLKLIVFSLLFIVTFFRIPDRVIEKMDWALLFNKRKEIVKQVEDKKLNPNVSWNGWVCELPFEFPVVSNGGNDIGINRNEKAGTITVTFWVFRNFFEAPSTYFIYTNDAERMKAIEEKIKMYPLENWKICENWFRTKGDY